MNVIHRMEPDRDVKIMQAEGLRDCRKMMAQAKAGKLNGYLLEGMGCPGGCVAGAGTIRPINKAMAQIALYQKSAPIQNAEGSEFKDLAETLD